MSLPVLLIVAAHPETVLALETQLGETFHVEPVPSLSVVTSGPSLPWGILADFRKATHGGHWEAAQLERLRDLSPRPEVIVLTASVVPEPLERELAGQNITPWREPVDFSVVIADLTDRLPREVVKPPAPRELPETEPGYVVSGMTRRFETNTPRLQMMLADLEVASRHDVTVLLIGETGAGKTFLSKLVHEISPRRNEPFLHLACGALPADLLESELFGHMKGSFTGAHADKDGKFVAAGRGTILLDEIDALGLEQQVKLLKVIESGEFEPVGSNRTLKSEARLIVASNLDLQPLVEKGRFRPDLYYRLNMLKFDILPLRARKADVIPLARKFVREQSAKHNIRVERIDESLFQALLRYPWPGNVRELEFVIQRAVIYCRDGILAAQHLPTQILMGQAGPSNDGHPVVMDEDADYESPRSTLNQKVSVSEREIIEQTLFQNNYSRTNTAKALGISRVTLYNKMKKYGMGK